jgi:hypothetical protein
MNRINLQLLAFVALLFGSFTAQAQELILDKTVAKDVGSLAEKTFDIKEGWTRGTSINLTASQTTLTNWFAGGDRFSLAFNGSIKANVIHKKKKNMFKSNFDGAFGLLKTSSTGTLRKTDDRWALTASFNRKQKNNLFYTLASQVKSQFTDGFSYVEGVKPNLVSTFFAPGDLKLGVGITYQHNTKFSLYVSPLTAKLNMKFDHRFRNQKIFGVDSGKTLAFDLGAFIRLDYKSEIKKGLTYTASFDAFYGYILKNYNFYMGNLFNWKLNKYFGATFSIDVAFDNTQLTPILKKNADGKLVNSGEPNKAQFQLKQIVGFGFNYSI